MTHFLRTTITKDEQKYRKKFTYRVRIAVPQGTGKTRLYSYHQLLNSFVDGLVKQLKNQGHRNMQGGSGSRDGYDDVYGTYLEQAIEINIQKSTSTLDEKIIWIE